MKEWKIFFLLVAVFLIFCFFPLDIIPFGGPFFEAPALVVDGRVKIAGKVPKPTWERCLTYKSIHHFTFNR
jgi:hypothetical protein